MNMHELESHQEADKGYCSSPRSAWYKQEWKDPVSVLLVSLQQIFS